MSRRFGRLELDGGRRVYVEFEPASPSSHARVLTGAPWWGGRSTDERIALSTSRTLAPLEPSKIICIGRNYRAHAAELANDVPAEPLLFFKPPSAVLGPGGAIELPPASVSTRIDHEAELGVVIGKTARRVSKEAAADVVFGATAVCDVTARDLQKKDGQWTRAKGMDTFCPVGPTIVTDVDLQALSIECRVNGAVRQRGSTGDMIFPVATVIAYISQFMTLYPGDLVVTGTPSGVGPLAAGDRLEVEIDTIGVLAVSVVAASEAPGSIAGS